MGYSAPISFKQLEENEIYPFLLSLRESVKANLDEIARKTFWLSTIKEPYFDSLSERVQLELLLGWALRIFSCSWFYIPSQKLLGILGTFRGSTLDLFDGNYFFDSHGDTDYDLEYWNGVDYFSTIADFYKNTSDEDIIQHFKTKWNYTYNEGDDLDYYRRCYCYEDIWSQVEEYFKDDNKRVGFLIFNPYYDYEILLSFINLVKDYYNAQRSKNSYDSTAD